MAKPTGSFSAIQPGLDTSPDARAERNKENLAIAKSQSGGTIGMNTPGSSPSMNQSESYRSGLLGNSSSMFSDEQMNKINKSILGRKQG